MSTPELVRQKLQEISDRHGDKLSFAHHDHCDRYYLPDEDTETACNCGAGAAQDDLDQLRSDRGALVAALTAVLDLHRAENPTYMPRYGNSNYALPKPRGKRCATCWDGYRAEDRWPCATYRAIAAGLGVTP